MLRIVAGVISLVVGYIAVGFAARDTLANLFAGFFIIADAPYKLGDYIVLDGGERGFVVNVGVRDRYRIRLKVGVAYGSDLDQVCALIGRVAEAHAEVTKDPAPRVRNRGFGDSSVDFQLPCWIKNPAQRGRITHELLMEIYKVFQREGVVIPFPQRDLWIRSTGGGCHAEPAGARIGPSETGQSGAGPSGAGPSGAGPSGTDPSGTGSPGGRS